MSVTMKDIAEELGISIGTVSKVLRDHPDISEEMRERVRKRIQEVNYRPNLTARALVTGRTYTAGLVVPDRMQHIGKKLIGIVGSVMFGPVLTGIMAPSADAASRN